MYINRPLALTSTILMPKFGLSKLSLSNSFYVKNIGIVSFYVKNIGIVAGKVLFSLLGVFRR